MKTSLSNLNIQKVVEVPCAHLYFMNNIVIVEIKRHEVVGSKEVIPILDAVETELKDLNDVHYISNRVEIYSLKPTELVNLKSRINEFKSYSVITYGNSGNTNLAFERMFLKKSITKYDSLDTAVHAAKTFDDNEDNSFNVA